MASRTLDRRRTRRRLALPLGAALLAAAPAAADTLYQWTDSNGAVRYTTKPERVPVVDRARLEEVQAGRSARENAEQLEGAYTEGGPAEAAGFLEPEVQVPAPEIDPFNEPAEAAKALVQDRDALANDPEMVALEQRILELEIAVARDREATKLLLTKPEGTDELPESPELDEIAARLPRLEQELAELRARRDRVLGGAARRDPAPGGDAP